VGRQMSAKGQKRTSAAQLRMSANPTADNREMPKSRLRRRALKAASILLREIRVRRR
jgi:hypothetical protein